MLFSFIKDKVNGNLAQNMPVFMNAAAGFAFDTVTHVKEAVQDKAHATARKLDLVERAELEELRARVAVLEEKLAGK